MNEDHARLFVLHGASGDLSLFRKVVSAKLESLGLDSAEFEPFSDAAGDSHSHDINLRSYLDWVDSLAEPADGDSEGEKAMKVANAKLLGRLAATLDRRYPATA